MTFIFTPKLMYETNISIINQRRNCSERELSTKTKKTEIGQYYKPDTAISLSGYTHISVIFDTVTPQAELYKYRCFYNY